MKFMCGLLASFVGAAQGDIIQLSDNPQFVLELNGHSGFPNSVDLNQQNRNENQLLTLSNGQIQVSNRPNLCLCAPSLTNGVPLQFNTCGSCPNGGDQWSIASPGYRNTINPSSSSNMCIDVKDGNIANGATIQLWTCYGNSQQYWTLISSLTARDKTENEAHSMDTPGNPCPFCHKIVNSQGICQPCLTTQWSGTCSCGPGSSDWIKADQCHECTDESGHDDEASLPLNSQTQSMDTPGNPCPFCHKIVNSQGVCQPCLTTQWSGTCSCGPGSSDWIKEDQCHECTDESSHDDEASLTLDAQMQSTDTPGNPCPFCHKIVNSQGVCQPCLTTQWAGTCSCGPGSSDWIKADQCHECEEAAQHIVV